MGTSWVALSIKNIKTPASREMTSPKNIDILEFIGGTLPSTGMWRARYLTSLIVLYLLLNDYSTDSSPQRSIVLVSHITGFFVYIYSREAHFSNEQPVKVC